MSSTYLFIRSKFVFVGKNEDKSYNNSQRCFLILSLLGIQINFYCIKCHLSSSAITGKIALSLCFELCFEITLFYLFLSAYFQQIKHEEQFLDYCFQTFSKPGLLMAK